MEAQKSITAKKKSTKKPSARKAVKPPPAGGRLMIAEQLEINAGQRKINGQLCHVDQILVEVIKVLKLEIAKLSAFSKANFDEFNKLLEYAYRTSAAVASVKPPGCEPAYTVDPTWNPMSPTPPKQQPPPQQQKLA